MLKFAIVVCAKKHASVHLLLGPFTFVPSRSPQGKALHGTTGHQGIVHMIPPCLLQRSFKVSEPADRHVFAWSGVSVCLQELSLSRPTPFFDASVSFTAMQALLARIACGGENTYSAFCLLIICRLQRHACVHSNMASTMCRICCMQRV